MIKAYFKIIMIVALVWLLGSIALYKACDKPLQEPDINEYLLQSDTYRPPIVKLPFTKDKAPVKKEYLPIPRKDVKTTIIVKSPVPSARDITLIVDKKGKVYRSKDTPEDAKIEVTHWKPALFGLQNEWGIGVIMNIPPDLSFALSWDPIRIWKLHFGLDLGAKFSNYGLTKAWVGVSVKYRILKNNNLFMLVGYNGIHRIPYMGIMMRF